MAFSRLALFVRVNAAVPEPAVSLQELPVFPDPTPGGFWGSLYVTGGCSTASGKQSAAKVVSHREYPCFAPPLSTARTALVNAPRTRFDDDITTKLFRRLPGGS